MKHEKNEYDSIITDAVLIDEDIAEESTKIDTSPGRSQRVFYVDHPPPPGVPSGGVWGQQHYRGPLTVAATVGGMVVACFPALLLLVFRMDRRDAYQAPNGEFYDVHGQVLGDHKKIKFVPNPPKMLVEAVPA
ncbi:hypothetical protein FisN_16Hh089 [Fistulifera solaris]|jgi:hypothetical protein|uniref:Uncharacterized protein n=1 Tax=Fistulifera solaris TaxID=1519565 RepID=A0A1Z5KT40_FISSO|nr:hypothetical protein FisN_16Hh089 [Fistulifera solaris]|eukprot:GAX29469.1 hypothetical protein FisN_16Hh089 [Fistulifera solaris]